jgi:probable HAF family extracellular repeat protein
LLPQLISRQLLCDNEDARPGQTSRANGNRIGRWSKMQKISATVLVVASLWASGARAQSFTQIDYPGAAPTLVTGINNNGQIVGYYVGSCGGCYHGFVDSGGTFSSPIDYPGAGYTLALGINDNGAIVGASANPTTSGFLYNNGSFSTIVGSSYASGINNVRDEIRATKALTKRPFGVNLVLTQPQEDRLAICLAEGVSIISFFWGQAGPLTAAAHRGGAKVLHTVANADAARISVDDGADAIIAQGWEAGGHVLGRVSTLALVPAVFVKRDHAELPDLG